MPASTPPKAHPSGVTVHVGVLPSPKEGVRRQRGAGRDYWDYLVACLVIGAVFLAGRYWLAQASKPEGAPPGSLSESFSKLFPFRKPPATPVVHANTAERFPQPDTAPVATSIVPAAYTQQARYAGFQGKVFVTVLVDERGVPFQVEPTGPIPFDLEIPVRDAVLHWRFSPALVAGKPVESRTVVEVPLH